MRKAAAGVAFARPNVLFGFISKIFLRSVTGGCVRSVLRKVSRFANWTCTQDHSGSVRLSTLPAAVAHVAAADRHRSPDDTVRAASTNKMRGALDVTAQQRLSSYRLKKNLGAGIGFEPM